jgi:hypothetical protein
MRSIDWFKMAFCFSIIFVLGAVSAALGQTAIFGVPTTEIHREKTLYIEADFFGHFDKYRNGGFQSYGPSVIYGVNKKLEIGANLYFTNDGETTAAEFEPNIKWRAYENEEKGVAVAVGTIAYVPLNKAAGSHMTAMFYTNASKKLGKERGPTFTGGIYRIVGGDADFGTRTGALVGLQLPATEKLTFLADWTSGKNRFGYSNFGFGYEVTRSQYLTIGYAVGNSGRGNNYLSALYGFTF